MFTDILQYFSPLELESPPSGGWGYDHFPLFAAYSRNLGSEKSGSNMEKSGSKHEFSCFRCLNTVSNAAPVELDIL
ncbi:MAG: hypothetical protein WCI51_20830 [Lentisphaerota bacterium]